MESAFTGVIGIETAFTGVIGIESTLSDNFSGVWDISSFIYSFTSDFSSLLALSSSF